VPGSCATMTDCAGAAFQAKPATSAAAERALPRRRGQARLTARYGAVTASLCVCGRRSRRRSWRGDDRPRFPIARVRPSITENTTSATSDVIATCTANASPSIHNPPTAASAHTAQVTISAAAVKLSNYGEAAAAVIDLHVGRPAFHQRPFRKYAAFFSM